jgi:hypothetical protein
MLWFTIIRTEMLRLFFHKLIKRRKLNITNKRQEVTAMHQENLNINIEPMGLYINC